MIINEKQFDDILKILIDSDLFFYNNLCNKDKNYIDKSFFVGKSKKFKDLMC